jgi:Domain of unknown function (DUF4280)
VEKLAVVDGTNIIICTGGAALSTLTVTTAHTPPVNGAAVATIQDHKPDSNVKPFGTCKFQGDRPCHPDTPHPWMPGAKDVLTGEASSCFPTLTENSFLNCHKGGIIQIIAPGQSVLKIGSKYELIYDENGKLIGYARLHDGEIMSVFDTDGNIAYVKEGAEGDSIFIDIALTFSGGIGIKMLGKTTARILARRAEKKFAEDVARKTLAGAGVRAGRSGTTTIDDILRGSRRRPGKVSKSIQRDRDGGFAQANKDFDGLSPKNVKDHGNGLRTGELEDGTKVSVRRSGREGKPTLQIEPHKGKRVKVRYDD